jgi:hypothetical protein
MKIYRLVLIINSFLLFSSCLSVMEKTGRLIDGSSEKIIALYSGTGKNMEITRVENKAGDQSILISLSRFPYMKVRGSSPDEQGEFNLVSLEYLGGSVHGWTEYKMELLGAGFLFLDNSPSIKITDDIETVQISAGRIHRYDTRVTGGEALTSLRNRRERILSLTEWMSSRQNVPQGLELEHFEKYWKPVLFPELSPEKSRPDEWAKDGDVYVTVEDIRWNTSYTEREFTEQLALVRDSGTLLRDWEDAVSWIYLEYEWEKIKFELSRETTLTKIK